MEWSLIICLAKTNSDESVPGDEMLHSENAFKSTIPRSGSHWRLLYDWNTVATTQHTATFWTLDLQLRVCTEENIIMFFWGTIRVKNCMNERVLLVHVCTDPSLHTFCCCRCRGVRGGDTVLVRIWDTWLMRNRETFAKSSPPPPTSPILPGCRQRNLKCWGYLSGTIHVTGRCSAGTHYFSGVDSYLVYITKRSCSCHGV